MLRPLHFTGSALSLVAAIMVSAIGCGSESLEETSAVDTNDEGLS